MCKSHFKRIKYLLQCVFFALLVGVFCALILTAFKVLADLVIRWSSTLYAQVRNNPVFLPLLVLGALVLGLISCYCRSLSRNCRGGGIPTTVAVINGILSFKWLASLFLLPFCALLTFLSGIPLGTEGPSVQMGAAIGDGVIHCFGKKNYADFRKNIMVGGASAGFCIATASPISAIVFSLEELRQKFSLTTILITAICVVTAQITAHFLALLGFGSVGLFHLSTVNALPVTLMLLPVIVGVVCGLLSIVFTQIYQLINRLLVFLVKKLSPWIIYPSIFVAISIVGFFLVDSLGTGHSIIDALLSTRSVWYVLILVFLVRALIMMISNTAGVTGGIFLPTLTFGAIIGSLCGEFFIATGLMSAEHYTVMVALGISAFLGATSRIPLTSCIFSVEALGCINNILPVAIATFIATIIVEVAGVEDFTDTVIKTKLADTTTLPISHHCEDEINS